MKTLTPKNATLEPWSNPELGEINISQTFGENPLLKCQYKMDITWYYVIILNFPMCENGMVSMYACSYGVCAKLSSGRLWWFL